MIKRLNSKALWASVLVCALPVYGQTDQGVVRLYLKSTVRDGPPDTLPVYVEVATVQPHVEEGIVFTFNIENNGSEPIRILDPVDAISINLYSFKLRGGVNFRNTEPDGARCKIRQLNKQQLKAYQDDKKSRRPFQAFHSEEALRDQRVKTLSDIVPWDLENHIGRRNVPQTVSERFEAMTAGKLTLEPGERFQAVLRITRILANPTRAKHKIIPRQGNIPARGISTVSRPPRITDLETETVDIAHGTYSLTVHGTVWTDKETDVRTHTEDALWPKQAGLGWTTTSDPVTIQLGEPSSPDEQNGNNTP